eukprot:TRINITY_DN7330_c0_g2_i1.p1 TRINITY_DN7330_c0_g2~~TRINITY_DN7330_c0_g2_i1.p1  ORF type:complete len:130 (+),score=38.24 TRINITY_DN7330_c0_g2_i1:30-392(+)
MIRRPPRSTHCISSAASDVYKRQILKSVNTPQIKDPPVDCSLQNISKMLSEERSKNLSSVPLSIEKDNGMNEELDDKEEKGFGFSVFNSSVSRSEGGIFSSRAGQLYFGEHFSNPSSSIQ